MPYVLWTCLSTAKKNKRKKAFPLKTTFPKK